LVIIENGGGQILKEQSAIGGLEGKTGVVVGGARLEVIETIHLPGSCIHHERRDAARPAIQELALREMKSLRANVRFQEQAHTADELSSFCMWLTGVVRFIPSRAAAQNLD
jgi:hypothetical protein